MAMTCNQFSDAGSGCVGICNAVSLDEATPEGYLDVCVNGCTFYSEACNESDGIPNVGECNNPTKENCDAKCVDLHPINAADSDDNAISNQYACKTGCSFANNTCNNNENWPITPVGQE